MNRFTPLRARSERRPELSSRLREQLRHDDLERDASRHAERLAVIYGAEYGQHYLRELVFKAHGCQLCGKFHPPAVLHHTLTKARLGKAEHQVVLGQRCHDKGHTKGWKELERIHSVDLVVVAGLNAAAGREAGYLPVEKCALCSERGDYSKAWHSRIRMIDQIREDGPPVRICVWCAGEGPP